MIETANTVGELITILQKYDPNAIVDIELMDGDWSDNREVQVGQLVPQYVDLYPGGRLK